MTRSRRIGVAVGAIIFAFALYEIVTSFVAYTADAYVQSDLVRLAPQVTGHILAVHVADNQSVAEGDPLVTIDPTPFQLEVEQHKAEVDGARARVAVDQDFLGSSRDSLIAVASAAAYARDNQQRLAVLAKEQDVTRAELDQADDALRRADAALDGAQQAIAQAQSVIAMHQAAQARATAALATAEWRLARTRIVAPTSGTINNLTVRVGDTAAADVPLIGIVDAHAWRIVANYKESFIRSFETGATPGCGSVPSRGP